MKRKKILALCLTISIIFSILAVSFYSASAVTYTYYGDYKCVTAGAGKVKLASYLGTETNLDLPSTFEGGVKVVGIYQDAFNSSQLTSVTIPEGYTSIGARAFYGSKNLTSITVPASVTEIGIYAFAFMESLQTLNFADNSALTAIPAGMVQNCGQLENIAIPSKVKTIGMSAFQSSSISSITVPEYVTAIGEHVFEGCTSLTDVALNCRVSEIPSFTFSGCTALKSIELPETVTIIDDCAFEECTSLESVELSPFLQSIGYEAFYNDTALKTIYIPDSVNYMGIDCFEPMKTHNALTIQCHDNTFASQHCYENYYKFETLEKLLGDVNLDGKIDVRDVTAIQKIIAGSIKATCIQKEASDMNGDNSIGVRDVTTLQRNLVGLD